MVPKTIRLFDSRFFCFGGKNFHQRDASEGEKGRPRSRNILPPRQKPGRHCWNFKGWGANFNPSLIILASWVKIFTFGQKIRGMVPEPFQVLQAMAFVFYKSRLIQKMMSPRNTQNQYILINAIGTLDRIMGVAKQGWASCIVA